MRVHLYTGSLALVQKSGVGQAVSHQKAMLRSASVEVTESWEKRADAVHINTVLPDSFFAALRARLRGETVVYYGHSTMQDFCNSFVGSNLLAPLFRWWICRCYNMGDYVLTPTPYSQSLLKSYHLKVPVYSISNGVDTEFFSPSESRRQAFRQRYGLTPEQKTVISVGHYMERKGILEFIELARSLPDVRFFWFGYTDPVLVPQKVRTAMANAPENVSFPGFVDQAALRDAYCGADLFAFCSKEETEGIVVLEALACGVPTLLCDIPVYADWLTDGVNVYKASSGQKLAEKTKKILSGSLPSLTQAGRSVAAARSLPAMGRKLCSLYEICRAAPISA